MNSRGAMVAGGLWLLSALLLLPGIWIGLAYGYSLSEWLSLIPFPVESDEVVPWFLRTIALSVFIGSTVYLTIYSVRKARLARR